MRRAAAATPTVHVKPLPFTVRTDFPPPMSTVFGWQVTPGTGAALAP